MPSKRAWKGEGKKGEGGGNMPLSRSPPKGVGRCKKKKKESGQPLHYLRVLEEGGEGPFSTLLPT